MQLCGFAAITFAVMQASLCKEGITVTDITHTNEIVTLLMHQSSVTIITLVNLSLTILC
jgi:hypothetical protein